MRLEVPRERREQPRPAKDIAGAVGLDENIAVRWQVGRDGDAPALDAIELVRGFSCPEQNLIGLERHLAGRTD